jgi:hypothetical protein
MLSTFCSRVQTLAVAAVGVFEHGQLALAVAAHDGEGILQGQRRKIHGRELVDAVFGQVALGAGVEQLALDQVVALGIGIEQVGADAHFVQPGHGGGLDFVDLLSCGMRSARDLRMVASCAAAGRLRVRAAAASRGNSACMEQVFP